MTILAVTAGLAHITAFAPAWREMVSLWATWLANAGFRLNSAPCGQQYQVQFAHAGNDGLTRFLVGVGLKVGSSSQAH